MAEILFHVKYACYFLSFIRILTIRFILQADSRMTLIRISHFLTRFTTQLVNQDTRNNIAK